MCQENQLLNITKRMGIFIKPFRITMELMTFLTCAISISRNPVSDFVFKNDYWMTRVINYKVGDPVALTSIDLGPDLRQFFV